MRIPDYYKKLTGSAKRKDKDELEVYRCVSKKVDDILLADSEQDKILLIKSLIAYFEGKSSNSWYVAIMPVAFALIIGAASFFAALNTVSLEDKQAMMCVLVVAALLVIIVASINLDFEKKMVLRVLNDKLGEYEKMKSTHSGEIVEINIIGVIPEDAKHKNKDKGRKQKKKSKSRKRNK